MTSNLVSTLIYFESMPLMNKVITCRLSLLTAFLLISGWFWAQDIVYTNINYAPERIRSIQFEIAGAEFTLPIVGLNSSTKLLLSFDDLDPDVRNLTYNIIHCDRNWQPTDLNRLDYLDGFEHEELDNYKFSLSTRVPYTHYEVILPNAQTQWKLSGNYALLVYDIDEDEDNPLFVRRFLVNDPKVNIFPEFTNPIGAGYYNTHQEIDFELTFSSDETNILRPASELKATVMQNYRWDASYSNLRPTVELAEKVVFDYQGKVLFPAGKEFRGLDLRSLDTPLGNVKDIQRTVDKITVFTDIQSPRTYENYHTMIDVNGQFIIFNLEDNNVYSDLNRAEEFEDIAERIEFDRTESGSSDISAEYAQVIFGFDADEYPNHDLYIYGSFNGWELDVENRMIYDEQNRAYIANILLKQGYYDYQFIAVPKNKAGEADPIDLEGNWFETNNIYTILIYQKSFGARYEQLVGVKSFFSNQ